MSQPRVDKYLKWPHRQLKKHDSPYAGSILGPVVASKFAWALKLVGAGIMQWGCGACRCHHDNWASGATILGVCIISFTPRYRAISSSLFKRLSPCYHTTSCQVLLTLHTATTALPMVAWYHIMVPHLTFCYIKPANMIVHQYTHASTIAVLLGHALQTVSTCCTRA